MHTGMISVRLGRLHSILKIEPESAKCKANKCSPFTILFFWPLIPNLKRLGAPEIAWR